MGAPEDDGNGRGLSRFLPVLTWLPAYDRADLRPDAMAAVTMAAFSIPELMAFAKLAGLAPLYGLMPVSWPAWRTSSSAPSSTL